MQLIPLGQKAGQSRKVTARPSGRFREGFASRDEVVAFYDRFPGIILRMKTTPTIEDLELATRVATLLEVANGSGQMLDEDG